MVIAFAKASCLSGEGFIWGLAGSTQEMITAPGVTISRVQDRIRGGLWEGVVAVGKGRCLTGEGFSGGVGGRKHGVISAPVGAFCAVQCRRMGGRGETGY